MQSEFIVDTSEQTVFSSQTLNISDLLYRSQTIGGSGIKFEEHTKREENTYAVHRPGIDLELLPDSFNPHCHGIAVYRDKATPLPSEATVNDFTRLLSKLLNTVFTDVPEGTVSVFTKVDDPAQGFNMDGAIFLNMRYFEQVHAPQIERDGVLGYRRAFFNWFTILCHELAHNGESGHNAHFINFLEEIVAHYMIRMTHILDEDS